jgi:cytochrome c-type biogenesis protein CcmI
MIIATAVLLVALPFLLWPLLRGEQAEEATRAEDVRDTVREAVEELELDVASGRLERLEADRRIAELRREAAS